MALEDALGRTVLPLGRRTVIKASRASATICKS
jgi:hypothetical protein